MVRTTDTKKKSPADRNPLYVVAGASDLAAEKLRAMPVRLAAELRSEPRAVAKRLGALPHDMMTLSERAQTFARINLGKAGHSYDELASRGKRIVGRIRRQQPTGELAEQAGRTGRKASATKTAARKGAMRTTRSAKATATEANKTTRAATKTAKASAEKLRD